MVQSFLNGLMKYGGVKTDYYKKYLENEELQYHNSSDIFRNIFEDALSMQAERIVNNIMQSLKCSKKRAHEIAFCDVIGEN